MSLHNFRRPKQPHPKPKSMDGILGAPSGPRSTRAISETAFQQRSLGGRAAQRRLDDFHRSDGYHAVDQPQMRSSTNLRRPVNSATPSMLHKTITAQPPLKSSIVTPTKPAKKKPGRVRKWVIRSGLATVVLIAIVGGLLFTKGYFKLHQIFKGGSSAAALQANIDPSLLKGEGDGRVNVLLLGIGGDGHDGPDLTDTMMVASVDPVNHKAVLLSIPRDMWVKMPNNYVGNYQKINAAYEAGKYTYLGRTDDSNANQQAVLAGFKTADQAVTQVLGISIDYNVLVNFQAFRQAVDTLGGITVNVPTQLYDPTMAWQNGGNPVLAQPGIQTFNGQKALQYVRSRETTSDFARAERQRSVLVAIKQKILTLGTFANPVKDSQLASAFGDNVVTDLSITNGLRLYSIGKQISNNDITSIGLADAPNSYVTTDTVNGLSVVRPTAGFYDYRDIQAYVRSKLPDGYIVKENAQINILNGTTTAGLATDEAVLLKSYGYNVGTAADAPTQNYAHTILVDLSGGVDKYTKHYLENRFGVSAVTKLPDSSILPGGAKFVIIIGQDNAISNQT